MSGKEQTGLGTFAVIVVAGAAFFAQPCTAAQDGVSAGQVERKTVQRTPVFQSEKARKLEREKLILITPSSQGRKGMNSGELIPADQCQGALQEFSGGHNRTDELKKRMEQLSDVHPGPGVQDGIDQGATGHDQQGALDKLGIGTGAGQKMREIESRFPSIGGTRRSAPSSAEGEGGAMGVFDEENDKNSQSDSTSKSSGAETEQAGSAAADAASDAGTASGDAVTGGNAGTAVGAARREGGFCSSYGQTSPAEAVAEWLRYQAQGGANSNDDVDGTGDGNDNVGKAQAAASRAQASSQSVIHQISHGSGEKPGATDAPSHRVPVKRGGKAPVAGRGDGVCGNNVVKLNLPKTGPTVYDPASEGIGVDVQPK